jgi:hypothetical protein
MKRRATTKQEQEREKVMLFKAREKPETQKKAYVERSFFFSTEKPNKRTLRFPHLRIEAARRF